MHRWVLLNDNEIIDLFYRILKFFIDACFGKSFQLFGLHVLINKMSKPRINRIVTDDVIFVFLIVIIVNSFFISLNY